MVSEQPLTVITYGDSWTYGSVADGWYEARKTVDGNPDLIYGSWAQQLKRYLQLLNPETQFFNQGVAGWTGVQGAAAFEERVLSLKPNFLVLNFGINDWQKYVSLEHYQQAMEYMVKSAVENHCEVVLWTSGPLSIQSEETYGWESPKVDHDFPHRYQQFTQTLQLLATKYQQPLADVEREIIALWKAGTDLTDWFYDAIHFTQRGHDVIFEQIKQVLGAKL